MQGVGGTVPYPPDYLTHAYAHTHAFAHTHTHKR
jgi:hypothetical protein